MLSPTVLENMSDIGSLYNNNQNFYDYHFNYANLSNLLKLKDIAHLNNLFHPYCMPFTVRSKLIKEYGIFGLPTIDSVRAFNKIIKGRPVYDLGCGSGYLSYALKKVNPKLKVHSIDNGSWPIKHSWVPIYKTNMVEFAKTIKKSFVIINWPCMDDDAYKTVTNLHASNIIIHIGEYQGCTANDKFFESFEMHPVKIPWFRWASIRDFVMMVRK